MNASNYKLYLCNRSFIWNYISYYLVRRIRYITFIIAHVLMALMLLLLVSVASFNVQFLNFYVILPSLISHYFPTFPVGVLYFIK